MPYAPNAMYNPGYNAYQQPMQQPINGLVSVTGIDGAKAYQLPPNSSMPLFDANSDTMYLKTTDGAGFPTIKEFTFAPKETVQEPAADYVPRSEFDELAKKVEELTNAKQPVSRTKQQ